ncbi:MAG: hypothetical protein MI923_01185 [Phycisphaerales bacterium]|nr:hypothetical protein [Phycisphaerales bacterium]
MNQRRRRLRVVVVNHVHFVARVDRVVDLLRDRVALMTDHAARRGAVARPVAQRVQMPGDRVRQRQRAGDDLVVGVEMTPRRLGQTTQTVVFIGPGPIVGQRHKRRRRPPLRHPGMRPIPGKVVAVFVAVNRLAVVSVVQVLNAAETVQAVVAGRAGERLLRPVAQRRADAAGRAHVFVVGQVAQNRVADLRDPREHAVRIVGAVAVMERQATPRAVLRPCGIVHAHQPVEVVRSQRTEGPVIIDRRRIPGGRRVQFLEVRLPFGLEVSKARVVGEQIVRDDRVQAQPSHATRRDPLQKTVVFVLHLDRVEAIQRLVRRIVLRSLGVPAAVIDLDPRGTAQFVVGVGEDVAVGVGPARHHPVGVIGEGQVGLGRRGAGGRIGEVDRGDPAVVRADLPIGAVAVVVIIDHGRAVAELGDLELAVDRLPVDVAIRDIPGFGQHGRHPGHAALIVVEIGRALGEAGIVRIVGFLGSHQHPAEVVVERARDRAVGPEHHGLPTGLVITVARHQRMGGLTGGVQADDMAIRV